MSFALLLLGSLASGKSAGRLAAMWRGPQDKKLRALPISGKEERPAASSHMSEPSWKWILHSKASRHMTAALANRLIVTS